MEVKNALIESVSINTGDRGLLTAYLHLIYDGGGQGFGGHALYLPPSFANHKNNKPIAGHFIFRCMEIADVEKWEDLKGKPIRVKATWDKVESIGHFLKDEWFNPTEEFKLFNQ